MPRKCPFTGKKTRAGRSITRRGRAKYLGGVGRKITGGGKRKFRVNMQRVRTVINGRTVRMNVSAKAIRNGMLVKPTKRDYSPPEED